MLAGRFKREYHSSKAKGAKWFNRLTKGWTETDVMSVNRLLHGFGHTSHYFCLYFFHMQNGYNKIY